MIRKPGRRISPANPEKSTLTVVICSTGMSKGLAELVTELCSASGPELHEVLLVHNGPDVPASAYGSLTRLQRVRALRSAPGLANARNEGLAAVSTEIVAFLDHDVVLSEGWAAAVVDCFAMNADAAVIGGEVELQFPAPKPRWLDGIIEASLSSQRFVRKFQTMQTGEFLVGANIAFRTEHIRLVGGFPSYLGRVGFALLSNEEIVPQSRLSELGFRRLGTTLFSVKAPVPSERLTKQWLTRRFAWQAVSDSLATAFESSSQRSGLGDDGSPATSVELIRVRALVQGLLDGVSKDEGNEAILWHRRQPDQDTRQRTRGGFRLVEFEVGGHVRLAHRLREILDGRLTILQGNPWVMDSSSTRDLLLTEVSRALRAGERVLVVTADPLIRLAGEGLLEDMHDLDSSDSLQLLVHRPVTAHPSDPQAYIRRTPSGISFLPEIVTRKLLLGPRPLRTLGHPIIGTSKRTLSRRRAKSLMGVPGNARLTASIGSHSSKNIDGFLDSLPTLAAFDLSAHFLFMGGATEEQIARLTGLSASLPGRITNLLRTPADEFHFETWLDTELDIAFQAADVGVILPAKGDYFPSSALEHFRLGNPVMIPSAISWASQWHDDQMAFLYNIQQSDSVFEAYKLSGGYERKAQLRRAVLVPHRDGNVAKRISEIFTNGDR